MCKDGLVLMKYSHGLIINTVKFSIDVKHGLITLFSKMPIVIIFLKYLISKLSQKSFHTARPQKD